eukprot:11513339-Alexandrium_andersonii.AAC.1
MCIRDSSGGAVLPRIAAVVRSFLASQRSCGPSSHRSGGAVDPRIVAVVPRIAAVVRSILAS